MNTNKKAYREWINGHANLGWTSLELVAGLISEMGATQADAEDAVISALATSPK